MKSPIYSASDFSQALLRLLPRGLSWPRDADTVLASNTQGLGGAFARNAGRALDLLIDAFPATTYEMLTDWESALGLPGRCTALAPSIEGRQNQVVQALVDSGGQSLDYFVSVAATLGYTITITEFAQHTVTSSVSAPLNGADWAHAWQVNGLTSTVVYADVNSPVDEPLATWGNTVLECVFNAIKPAHTQLIFNYT